MIRKFALIAFFVLCTYAFQPMIAASQAALGQSLPPVTIKGSETHTLKSDETGRSYDPYRTPERK